MEQELPHPGLSELRVDEVAEGRWRVTDRRFRATNPRTLLGYIQQAGDHFEVTDVRRESEPVSYGSRQAAIAAFLPMAARLHSPGLVDAGEGRD